MVKVPVSLESMRLKLQFSVRHSMRPEAFNLRDAWFELGKIARY